MNFSISKVHIDGHSGPSGASTGTFVSTHGIEMVTNPVNAQAVDVFISEAWIFFVKNAVEILGYEGVFLDTCTFVAVERGLVFDSVDSNTPLVSFTNSQIAFTRKGIELIKLNQGFIVNSLIYSHASGADINGIGVLLTDTTTTKIANCTFVSNPGMKSGVSVEGSLSILNSVENCMFYSTILNPVSFGAGTALNVYRNNILGKPSVQTVLDGGTNNYVEGKVLGFYGANPISRPVLSVSPTITEVVTALKRLGLVE